jgi:hypothetical protein
VSGDAGEWMVGEGMAQMSEAIKSMDNAQLRELISTLARCAAPWTLESIGDGIDLAAAELLRRDPPLRAA